MVIILIIFIVPHIFKRYSSFGPLLLPLSKYKVDCVFPVFVFAYFPVAKCRQQKSSWL